MSNSWIFLLIASFFWGGGSSCNNDKVIPGVRMSSHLSFRKAACVNDAVTALLERHKVRRTYEGTTVTYV